MRERRCKQRLYGEMFSEFVAAVRVIDRLACCRVAKRLLDGCGHGRTAASLSSEPKKTANPASPGLAQFGAVSSVSPEPPEFRTMAAHSFDRKRLHVLAETFARLSNQFPEPPCGGLGPADHA